MGIRLVIENSREAIKELVKFAKMCLAIGGLPMIRTKYGNISFTIEEKGRKYRGLMILCYGRAEYLPDEFIFAPVEDKEWMELASEFEKYVGDYRILLMKYGHLVSDEEVEKELEKLLPRELREKLVKMPLIPKP
ncbi:MAG: hypothetical protein DRJ40_08105 [Thermoprotei archaeon]|nr:MAG: hypothetical protein DRJ40_08105 [Thermoprotei archaeon]